jgi:uncharacterized protein
MVLLAGLAGCATPPPTPPVESRLLQEARALEASGDPVGAARLYAAMAEQLPPAEAAELRLRAVDLLLVHGDASEAADVLARAAEAERTPAFTARTHLADAHRWLLEGQPRHVLRLLFALPVELPPALQVQVHELRAEAHFQLGDVLQGVHERVQLHPLLAPPADAENRQAIWHALSQLSGNELERLAATQQPEALAGWLELAHLVERLHRQPHELETRVAIWREQYPGHPAEELVATLLARPETLVAPEHVALLLPLSGRLAGPASAVRDGFLAAYYAKAQAGERPAVRIYDVGDEPAGVAEVYREAVRNGAHVVVGPLEKDSVAELARSGPLEVPVLALNTIEGADGPIPYLYQFGLSPEDEARQVADRAWHDGHRSAVALVPSGSWGERLLGAFRARWQELGGRLLESRVYTTGSSDYSEPIRGVLSLDDSEARNRALRGVLNRNLGFEPRRRQDADFLFLVALPREARLIRPQLNYYRAMNLPVYSTSHVYTGSPDLAADRDMDGIIFCDIPWLLSPPESGTALASVTRLWPESVQQYARLHALGVDAFDLLPYLNQLRDNPYASFPGKTGRLSLDAANRVHRELVWARFGEGSPRPLGDATPAATARR